MRFYDKEIRPYNVNKGLVAEWYDNNRYSRVQPNAKHCLYLVPDIGNKHDSNAIMISDGNKCLGHVTRAEAAILKRKVFKDTSDVICVYPKDASTDTRTGMLMSMKVGGFCKVNERLARKYAVELGKAALSNRASDFEDALTDLTDFH